MKNLALLIIYGAKHRQIGAEVIHVFSDHYEADERFSLIFTN